MRNMFALVVFSVLVFSVSDAASAATSPTPSTIDAAVLEGVIPLPMKSARTQTVKAVKTRAHQATADQMNALAPTTAEATAPMVPVMPAIQLPQPALATPAISGDNTNAVFDLGLGNLLNSRK